MEQLYTSAFYNILLSIISLIGIVGIVLSIKSYQQGTKYLPLVVLSCLLEVDILMTLIVNYVDFETSFYLRFLTEPFAMVYGVLVYLYSRNMINKDLVIKWSDLLFFIPFILTLLSYFPYYIMPIEDKIVDFHKYGALLHDITDNVFEWNFEIVVNTAFLLAALRELKIYNRAVESQSSELNTSGLHLTQRIIKVYLLVYIVEFILVYSVFFGLRNYELLFLIFELSFSIIMFMICYDAYVSRNSVEQQQQAFIQIEVEKSSRKYAKNLLNDDIIEVIKSKLKSAMQEKELYLNSQFKIQDIAKEIDFPSYQVSQVINESYNQNFNEFVNTYRVKKSCEILRDKKYDNYTLTAIGFESGFNSKSAFYNAFRKQCGITPAEYKQSDNQNDNSSDL